MYYKPELPRTQPPPCMKKTPALSPMWARVGV